MRNVCVFVTLIALSLPNGLTAQNAPIPSFNPDKKTFIEGVINNYTRGPKSELITFRIPTLSGVDKDTSVLIHEKGFFKCALYQPIEGELGIFYRSVYAPLYGTPSEKIVLTIDDAQWEDPDKTSAVKVDGPSSDISLKMIGFASLLTGHEFLNTPPLGDKNLSDADYAKMRTDRMKEELQLLNDYVITNQIKNERFVQWSRHDIIYRAGLEIDFQCFAGKINKTITYDQLMAFLEPMPKVQQSAMNSGAYRSHLAMLVQSFQIIANVNPSYEDSLRRAGNSRLLFALAKIDHYATGLTREFLYYLMFDGNNKECKRLLPRFEEVITDRYLKSRFTKIITPSPVTPSIHVLSKLREQAGPDSFMWLEQFLQNNAAYVFIDFWGTWCGPCMQEMPVYPRVIARFNDKPLKFLFLATDTDPEKMEGIKKKHGIKGTFILLTEKEKLVAQNVFQFNGYPSHFIINPAGILLNSIPQVGNENGLTESTLQKISDVINSGK